MKYTVASLVALASVASAQLSAIPQCALQCFIPVLQNDGCSALTDFKCHCSKGSSLVDAIVPCVMKQCTAQSDQVSTLNAVQNICKDAGVPLTVNIPATSALGASSAAAPASSAAATTPASSAAAGASSAVASVASSAAAAVSSAASKASSAAASATGAANATATSAKPSVSQFTGGAAMATQAAGLLGAAAIAMLAL